ncbi:glutamate-cysteine ligase catalytic subunit [Punctularia strigosozonata HHB-11173 SS5]|uniref:glutamate-cysteine ligase catalytic subunit n=1 Tax=Punctularia strigosozonata (strain HHB-11173) TaxID=741275 RepID=UPI000441816A|nr:glutamate-cysteine ligase catalytic subunit [Punctularia strigosozonata HHB-11173 SS5]EIN11676.1 glutamate-cysteine ligase catalytic subunit [Punctularia strigosozonata HHB-11173 SS5]
MGLLSLGTPLPWEEAKKYADHVREHGITQFLSIWDKLKDRQGDELLWGDEIEYMVVVFDNEEKNAKLSLRQSEILAKLRAEEGGVSAALNRCGEPMVMPTFHPEYGRYMLESTPGAPYSGAICDLLSVEDNMRFRRHFARKYLKPNELPLTFTSFPRLGTPGVFTEPHFDPSNAVSSHSLFLPQEITNPHARFPTLTANIRERRGSKVSINLPIFIDEKTPRPFVDPTIPWHRNVYKEDHEAKDGAAKIDHIYMDAMGFGMGCCCLQLTLQSCNVNEARRTYDALVPIAPILLALTAASPIYRGYLADVDCRWNVIAGSVDDRTDEERGLKPLKKNRFRIPKSRYDSVERYISNHWTNRPEYNDHPPLYDEAIVKRLRDHGIDELLAKHIGYLFIRDPLVIFSETIDQNDEVDNDHFENIQSTNWQTIRFKPPGNASIGWRVEFRSMEVQLTDFENAAFAVFLVLLTRAILAFNLNFYLPISKVDDNMQRAQKRDAARAQKFFFRKDVFPVGQESRTPSIASSSGVSSPVDGAGNLPRKDRRLRNCYPAAPPPPQGLPHDRIEDEYEEMTLEEIMTGKGPDFPGLIGLVDAFITTLDVDASDLERIQRYLDLVRKRSTGAYKTTATWIRDFVRSHPAYKHDSVVNQEINYDLMVAVDEIERGLRKVPDLLPKEYSCPEAASGALAGLKSPQ